MTSRHVSLCRMGFALVAAVMASRPAFLNAQLTPTRPAYRIKHVQPDVLLGPIDQISDTQLAAGAYSFDAGFNSLLEVKTVGLNDGPVSAPVYTQPVLPSPVVGTFAGGFLATDGAYALTGQTGFPSSGGLFPGRLFLTDLNTGATSIADVPGNFDAARGAAEFYASASAGTGTGLGDDGFGGVYRVLRSGGTLSGLNLVIDTGAPSGLVGADEGGNLLFSLGGASAVLGGGFDDIYRLDAAEVEAAVAAGTTTGLSGSAADLLVTAAELNAAAASFFASHTPTGGAVFPGLADLLFAGDDRLVVGMNGFVYADPGDFGSFQGTVGLALLLDMHESGGDYSASVRDILYTNEAEGAGVLTYRASDETLWVSADGNLYGLAVPEPTMGVLLGLGGLCLLARRRRP